MSWCPNCKSEYREGITLCPVCKVDLIDELIEEKEYKISAYMEDQELAERFAAFLEYSNIASKVFFDETEGCYAVGVEEKDQKAAKTAFKAFYQVESQKELVAKLFTQTEEDTAEAEASEESDADLSSEEVSKEDGEYEDPSVFYRPTGVYVRKADVSKEMSSTAVTFIVFAVGLLIFLILNATNVITFFNNVPSLVMLGLMAAGCLAVGLNAIKRAKKAEAESVLEEEFASRINDWLKANITEDFFKNVEVENTSGETAFLTKTDAIKRELIRVFGPFDPNFMDSLVEDFYNESFDADSEYEEEEPEEDVLVEVASDEDEE